MASSSPFIPSYFRERFHVLTEEELQDAWQKTIINWQQEFVLSLREGKPCSDWCQKMILYHLVIRESPDLFHTLPSSFWYPKSESESTDRQSIDRVAVLEKEYRQSIDRVAVLEKEFHQSIDRVAVLERGLSQSVNHLSNATPPLSKGSNGSDGLSTVHPPDSFAPTPFTTPSHSFQQIDSSLVTESSLSQDAPVAFQDGAVASGKIPQIMRF